MPAGSTSGTRPPRSRSPGPPGCTPAAADGAPLAYNQDDVWLPDLLVCRPELAAHGQRLRPRLLGRTRQVTALPGTPPPIMTLQALLPVVAAGALVGRRLWPGSATRASVDPRPDRPGSAQAVPRVSALAAGTVRRAPPVVLVVTATAREAEEIVEAARCLLDHDSVVEFPAWETLPARAAVASLGHGRAPARRPAPAGAPGGLRRPGRARSRVIVAPVRSVLQPQVKGLGDLEPVALREGDTVDLEDLVRRLAAAAYHRVDLVERRGEFAVRGGIVDVFPPTLGASRSAWSSGATRSRRSGPSRSPTSGRWTRPRTGCGRRRAASCC